MKAIDVLVSALTRIRNSLPPIAQLPTKQLCQIFEFIPMETPIREVPKTRTQTEAARFTHSPHLLPLRLVSKKWDTIITSHNPLWSCIQALKGSSQWLDLCLRRSGQSPLTVKKYLASGTKNHEVFLHHIAPHLHRTRELEVALFRNTDRAEREQMMSTLLSGCTISLDTLRISDHTSIQWSNEIYNAHTDITPLLGPHLAGVQTLALRGLPLPAPDLLPFTGLHRLSVESPLGLLNPVLRILSTCPTLSQVELCHPSSESTRIRLRFDFKEELREVEAPSLTYLKCSRLPPHVTATILKQIQAPQLRTLMLDYHALSDELEEHGILDALQHMVEGPLTGLEVLPHDDLLFRTSQTVVFLTRGGEVQHWEGAFQWIAGRSAGPLPVTFHASEAKLKNLLQWIYTARLPVSRLRLPNSPANVQCLCDFLQGPNEASPQSGKATSRPFPSLRTISLLPASSSPPENPAHLKVAPPDIEIVEEEWSNKLRWATVAHNIRWAGIDQTLALLRKLGYM